MTNHPSETDKGLHRLLLQNDELAQERMLVFKEGTLLPVETDITYDEQDPKGPLAEILRRKRSSFVQEQAEYFRLTVAWHLARRVYELMLRMDSRTVDPLSASIDYLSHVDEDLMEFTMALHEKFSSNPEYYLQKTRPVHTIIKTARRILGGIKENPAEEEKEEEQE